MHHMDLMRTYGVAAVLGLCACLTACGGGSSSTNNPSPTIDLTGTWSEQGGDLTWRLMETGANVSGTSHFSQDSGRYLGAVSGNGNISGTVSSATFSFTDSYPSLSK